MFTSVKIAVCLPSLSTRSTAPPFTTKRPTTTVNPPSFFCSVFSGSGTALASTVTAFFSREGSFHLPSASCFHTTFGWSMLISEIESFPPSSGSTR